MRFRGYRRNDGRIGIRNHVLILPASICASDVAHQVMMQVQGTVSFHNQLGCSQTPIDQECTLRTMAGMAANPNVYGTIIISLGCENCQMKLVTEEIQSRCDKPLKAFIIQECGGTLHTVEQAVRCAREMVAQASCMQREEADVSELMVAMEMRRLGSYKRAGRKSAGGRSGGQHHRIRRNGGSVGNNGIYRCGKAVGKARCQCTCICTNTGDCTSL